MQLMVVLKPLLDTAGIERLIVSTYQSVSGTGVKAVDELKAQTEAVLHGEQPPAPQVYPHPIAFNVLGGAGNFKDGDDYTDEERKMMHETRKILEAPDIGISVTCARVPVIAAHSESVNVQTREPIEPDAVRELLRAAPGARGRRRPGEQRLSRPRWPAPVATRCSSGASAATRRTRARSTSGSWATTCSRAPPPTRSRSPRRCTSGASCGFPRRRRFDSPHNRISEPRASPRTGRLGMRARSRAAARRAVALVSF